MILPRRNLLLPCILVLDAVQVLSLTLIPSPRNVAGLSLGIPQASTNSFLYVFLGNSFLGAQELIPLYSVYVYARSLYLLLPEVAMLGATWHITPMEAATRLFSFAYSWIEITMYSFAVMQSFVFLNRLLKRTLTLSYVLRTSLVLMAGLVVASLLEVMALMVI